MKPKGARITVPKKPTQPRVKKPIEMRLQDLETHLHFLWEAREAYRSGDGEKYKLIASELRILVCGFGTNKPLLLDLMDHYGFSYEVQPPGPPFDRQSISLVGWREDPVHKEIVRLIEEANGDASKLEAVRAMEVAQRRPIPLREYVDQGLAVFIAPYDYSHAMLVRAIAEQIGGAHEDEGIEEGLAAMHSIQIGGALSHVAALISFSDLIIFVGIQFLGHMITTQGFKPLRFQISKQSGD
jgi:hypothetical protein